MIKFLLHLFRPICPLCDGEGGGMSGYYEPEFYGCRCCNAEEDNEAEPTRVWRWHWWAFRFAMWREERRFDKMIEADEHEWNQEK
jgi:hypothetical protein